MTATSISYNGIQIERVRVTNLEAVPVLDQSGQIAQAIRYTVTFSGLINGPDHVDFVGSMRSLQHAFSEPRKRLLIAFGGENRFDINDPMSASTNDVANGPFPRDIRIAKVYGGRAASITGTIEWSMPISAVIDGEGLPVMLSHRFRQEFDTDEQNRVTRTVVGQAQFNGQIDSVNPDSFRSLVWPVESAGFRRVSARYAVSESGLSLAYQVVDIEGFRPYPKGVLVASGEHRISKTGAVLRHQLSATLKGEKYQNASILIEAAHDIIATRLNLDRPMESFEISEPLFDSNELSFSAIQIGTLSSSSSAGYLDWGLFQSATSDAGALGNAGRFRQITPYGGAGVRAVFQALFDPSVESRPSAGEDVRRASVEASGDSRIDLDGDSFAESYDPGTGLDDLAAGVTVPSELTTLPSAATLSNESSVISGDQKDDNPYTDSRCSFREYVETNSVIVPTADPNSADVVVQFRSPRVIREYVGTVTRVGASPVVPTPSELDDVVLRGFVLRSSDVRPVVAEPMADEATIQYSAAYRYVLESVYTPSGQFGSIAVSIENGSSGVLTQWTGQRTVPFVKPPTIESGFGGPTLEEVSAPISGGGGLV